MSYLCYIDDFKRPLQDSYWTKKYWFKSYKVYAAHIIQSHEWRWTIGCRELALCTMGEERDNLIEGKIPSKKEISCFYEACFNSASAYFTKEEMESYKKYLKKGDTKPTIYKL